MIAVLALIFALLIPGAAAAAPAGASDWFTTDQGRVRLVAAEPFVGAGKEVQLGLQFELAPHWKIYWRTPGDAGYPPHLDWQGSRNLAAARVEWPAPRRFSVLGLETAGYEGKIVLPIRATLSEPATPAALHLALDYLTCSEICIPYQTTLSLELPAGSAAGGGFGALIARAAAMVPSDGKAAGLALIGATVRPGRQPALEVEVGSDHPLAAPDAFVEGAKDIVFGAPMPLAGSAPDRTTLRLLAYGKDTRALVGEKLSVTVVDGDRAMTGTILPMLGAPVVDLAALLPMLLVALLGGFILNFMPCVLPVLALKLLGVIEHDAQGAVRRGFLATAAGILLSFLAMALVLIGLTEAGSAVGWGVQFQAPLFLAAMAALLTLFAANLWDLFEVPLPRPAAALAEKLGGRGVIANVATGAFATLLATPCSAPFLGTAVGFALTGSPRDIVAIFLALGVGFAAPYLLVAALPRLARLLPRPGKWMVLVRRALGVALAGTALWLVTVIAAESSGSIALVTGLLLAGSVAALAVLQNWPRRLVVAGALIAAVLLPAAAPAPLPVPAASALWRPFDPVALADLVRDGHVVLVDVTADWCLTCKVNERLVLESGAVRARLGASGVVAMRADWTRPDARIAEYLHRFGRYGVPFNAVYGPGAPAGLALPEILSADGVTAALRQAAHTGSDSRG
jgi:suppressor for copper-sensitivity B